MRAALFPGAALLASAVLLHGSTQAATPPRVDLTVQRPDPPLPVPRPHFLEPSKEEQGPPAPPKKPVAVPAPVITPTVAPPSVAAGEASCQAQLKAAGVIFEPT